MLILYTHASSRLVFAFILNVIVEDGYLGVTTFWFINFIRVTFYFM